MHIDAVLKNPFAYEHVDPEVVGNKRIFLLSEVSGRSTVTKKIQAILPEVKKGTNGEINLADAMGLAAERGMKLTGVLCDGLRFDCGTNKDLEKANLKLSLMEDPDLRSYCRDLLDTMFV